MFARTLQHTRVAVRSLPVHLARRNMHVTAAACEGAKTGGGCPIHNQTTQQQQQQQQQTSQTQLPHASQQEPLLTKAEEILESVEGSMDSIPLGSEVHSKLKLDRETVEKALEMKRSGQDISCPFLHQVDSTLRTDEGVKSAVSNGGDAGAEVMRKVIEESLWKVLRDLKEQKRYREFRYFKRTVGQHPEVVRPAIPNVPYGAHLIASSSASTHTRAPGKTEALLNSVAAELSVPPLASSTSSSAASGSAGSSDTAASKGSVPPPQAPPKGETLVNWCSNDYLNMAHSPVVMNAMIQAILEQGVGAGGTRNISGSNVLHIELEDELARISGKPAALLFNSCYMANLGVMQALGKALPKETIIFSDRENHASLVEGIKFSGLQKKVFRHNDVKQLEEQLAAADPKTPKIVVFESVYSMSGSRGRVSEILDLCERFGAISIIDEVHAVGLYGAHGAGVLEEIGQLGRANIITGTLGKAYGVSGGYIAASAETIDVIRSLAPSFIFTTSMSPPSTAAALASVRHVAAQSSERDRMRSTAAYLAQEMKNRGIPLMSSETHILPVLIGDGDLCKKISDELLQYRIYVQPINYPSVPKGEELLRFTASPKHTREHCEYMLKALTELLGKYNLLRTPEEVAAGVLPH